MTMKKFRFAETDVKSQQERKRELRVYQKKLRAENVNRDVKETRLIQHFYKAVFGEKMWVGTKRTFFIYLSFSSEAPTDKLIEKLKSDGHTVYCPRLENGEMFMVLHGEDFTLCPYGIREPVGEIYKDKIDVVVIPFLAVDRKGNRVGYGGGYYDRFLKKTTAKRVAYGYGFQVVKEVPTEAWDERVEMIVTDEEIIEVK